MAQVLSWITHLSDILIAIRNATQYLADVIEIFAAIIVGVATLEALVQSGKLFVQRTIPPGAREDVRLRLGRWLSVALEFELGADILRTAVAPSLGGTQALIAIGQLAAIAAIRTALNYFLQKEIDAAASRQGISPIAAPTVQQQRREAQAGAQVHAEEEQRSEGTPTRDDGVSSSKEPTGPRWTPPWAYILRLRH